MDAFSRYRFCDVLTDEDGKSYLSERSPFGYRASPDNLERVVVDNDTWWSIAGLWYRDLAPNPSMLFWIVCDYQPVPVVDPTLAIPAGVTVYGPHPDVVKEQILNESRRLAVEV